MSGLRILIVEGNPLDLIAAQGYCAAVKFKATFDALVPPTVYNVAEPYVTNFETCSLVQFDGVGFTRSGLNWGVDTKEAAPLNTVMEQPFKTDLPVWGSCNGMQLAVIVLGGGERSSTNELDVRVAKGISKTAAGKSHSVLQERAGIFAVPCIHHHEVNRLPIRAVNLAKNDHSSIQSFAYNAEGIDFRRDWYYPECPANAIAKSMRKGACIFSAAPKLIDDLEVSDNEIEAAKWLGTTFDALETEERTYELANWLIHVKDRILS